MAPFSLISLQGEPSNGFRTLIGSGITNGGRSVIEYHYKDVLPVMVDAAWVLLDVSEKPELEVVK